MNDRNERKFNDASWYVNLNVNDTVLDNSMFNMGFSNQGQPRAVTVRTEDMPAEPAAVQNVEVIITDDVVAENEPVVELEEAADAEEFEAELTAQESQTEEEPIIKKRGRKPKVILEQEQ